MCVCCSVHVQRTELTPNYSFQLIHPLYRLGGFFPFSSVNLNKHFLFIQHSHHSLSYPLCFFYTCPFLSTFMSNFFLSFLLSLSTPFSRLFHVPPSLLFLFLLFLQEPQTTVIHNPVDGTKVYIITQSRPALSSSFSFSSSSSSSPALWSFFLSCICVSALWQSFTNAYVHTCVCVHC